VRLPVPPLSHFDHQNKKAFQYLKLGLQSRKHSGVSQALAASETVLWHANYLSSVVFQTTPFGRVTQIYWINAARLKFPNEPDGRYKMEKFFIERCRPSIGPETATHFVDKPCPG
jgi:hypothetical protein